MRLNPLLARERIVSIWLNRPENERSMRHTEPFITELERDDPILLGQLRSVNHYQTVMELIRPLIVD
jgi:hypothetical protein